jgi:acyl carrier protein
MDSEQIIQQVNSIFIDILDNDDIKLSRDTTANDIEEWDSLNHIQLVVAIEKHFKIRFTTAEIYKWKNIGDMCDMIASKL